MYQVNMVYTLSSCNVMCQIYFNKTVLRIKTTVKSYFSSFPTLSSTILETFIFFVCSPKPIAMDQESALVSWPILGHVVCL